METRIAQVIDALVAKAGALPGYRPAATATADRNVTVVWDGPEFRGSDDFSPNAHLVVGYSGDDPEALTPAAGTTITAGPMAGPARPRDETGVINCRAVIDRQENPKAARDGAQKVLTDVAALCRADPTLGIQTSDTIGGVLTRSYVTAGEMYQYLRNNYSCEWEFTVTFKTRV